MPRYDPPSDDVLRIVADEMVAALNESVGRVQWCRESDPAFSDVVPPYIREDDVAYRCREDWHGGDPYPAMELLFGHLREAGAAQPLRPVAAAALEGFDARWAADHDRTPPPTSAVTAIWEISDAALVERRLFASAGTLASVSAEAKSAIARFRA